ncbi:hypothetical protein [Paracoccus sp. JM45]|uniref:hypothetical protein n=1 Tax=Paracoccus sp. JM45 TaxID=2283626 RepID=UPI000E6C1ED3|nr:hypothetical protein [Paracoccus sp. JM45]RJE81591.1 hypothetical protein DWB67_02890 [Paracoccus sp. JM45]
MSTTFRRHVLYLPGFDPIPPRRYRELYRREGADQARISGHKLRMKKAQPDGGGFAWRVGSHIENRDVETRIEVALWSDIVQASMSTGIVGTFVQLFRTMWIYIASGTITRLMRLRRGPVIAAFYPIAVLLVQLLLALLACALMTWGIAALGGGLWGLPVGAAAAWGVLVLGRRLDHRLFAYYLMHDYAFTCANYGAYPPALEDRITQFRDRLNTILAQDLDEVLIVGHSSGAYLAVSVLADLLREGPRHGPALSLLTLGHVVPMAGFLPRADRLRDDLAFLSQAEGIFWTDVTAPGDACCFALCDPVAVCGMAGPDQQWPLVISAAYTQTLSPERQKAIRNRWFRLHFQYLCAFDRPGDYDYFAITAGPQTLAQRFAGRKPSPGRITRPAGKRG